MSIVRIFYTMLVVQASPNSNIIYLSVSYKLSLGYVRTDMTNPNAPLSPEQGAKTPVYLALLPQGGATGGFFADQRQWDITKEL
jgi:hypothetical protein